MTCKHSERTIKTNGDAYTTSPEGRPSVVQSSSGALGEPCREVWCADCERNGGWVERRGAPRHCSRNGGKQEGCRADEEGWHIHGGLERRDGQWGMTISTQATQPRINIPAEAEAEPTRAPWLPTTIRVYQSMMAVRVCADAGNSTSCGAASEPWRLGRSC